MFLSKYILNTRELLGFLFAILIAVLALVSTLHYQGGFEYAQQILSSGIKISQSVARYEEKLTCLHDYLSPDAVVGFISLLPPGQAAEYHQLTQYALVPVLVELSTENQLIIGYVLGFDDIQNILAAHPDYRIVENCGNDIVLFERTP